MTAVGRLVASAARGSAPPPEPGLLEKLRRDRELHATVAIDSLSFVVSPNGFLTAARAVAALDSAVAAARLSALTVASPSRDGTGGRGVSDRAAPKARRPSAPLPLRPALSTTLRVKVGDFRSLLSLESRPLASLAVSGLAFEGSRSEWWDLDKVGFGDARTGDWHNGDASTAAADEVGLRTLNKRSTTRLSGWPGWTWTGGRHRKAMRFMHTCLESVSVLDLTPDGQLHSEVICHSVGPLEATVPAAPSGAATSVKAAADRRSSSSSSHRRGSRDLGSAVPAPMAKQAGPVVVIELTPAGQGESRGKELKVSVRGLRVCVLYRFIAEVAKYFGPDGLGPVFAVAGGFGARGGSVGGDKDVDEVMETEATTAREGKYEALAPAEDEEEKVPDEWYVLSSDGSESLEEEKCSSDGTASAEDPREGVASLKSPGAGGDKVVSAGLGVRLTTVFEDLVVVLPRSTHSLEAAAVTCDELVLEVGVCVLRVLCVGDGQRLGTFVKT